jgi:hypothetical protein
MWIVPTMPQAPELILWVEVGETQKNSYLEVFYY